MKLPAIKYRVIGSTTGHICFVIAVKKSETENFSLSAIAELFARSLENTTHQTASVNMREEGEFNFSAGKDVRLVEYMQKPSNVC